VIVVIVIVAIFGHVARTDTSLDITRALEVSIRGLSKDWRRPPGRPRHTWLRTLEADLISNLLTLASTQHGNTLRIENTRGNRYAPARGMVVMMMMMML